MTFGTIPVYNVKWVCNLILDIYTTAVHCE